jgi:hypothetical protein
VAQRLAVQGVEDGVAGTVSSSGATVRLTAFAEFERLTAKGSLVDLAFFGTRKGDTVVLELYISTSFAPAGEPEIESKQRADAPR